MIASYGGTDGYFVIEDDGRIRASGGGGYGSDPIELMPRRNPPPEEGCGGYEIWRGDTQQALEPSDRAIQVVEEATGNVFLFIFPAEPFIYAYYLGQNFHSGSASFLFTLEVTDQPANDDERWRIYEWLSTLS